MFVFTASSADMSEDPQRGRQCLVLQKQTELKAQMLKVREYYRRILSHQPLLDIDSEEEETAADDGADSDFSSSDLTYRSHLCYCPFVLFFSCIYGHIVSHRLS